MAQNAKTPKTSKRPAPTLYFIAAIKLIKGAVLLLVALGIFALAGKDLQDLFEHVVRSLGFDPENRFFSGIGTWLDQITPHNVRVVASGTFLCGLFLIVLGSGLAFRAKWAIWLAIGESAFFIPIEIFELLPRRNVLHHHSVGLLIVLIVNVAIVWYLSKNRERLFQHH